MSLSPRIAENPLLAGLPPVEQAKLLAELEERHYAPGETIFHAGDPGDALYLLAEGAVELRTGLPESEAVVTVLRAPDHFGEQALLTGDPRGTTVVAVGDVLVARLSKPRFDALLGRNPGLALQLGRVLSRRLHAARRAISEMRHGFEELAAARLAAVPPEQRGFMTRAAILRRLEPGVVDALLESHDATERLARLAHDGLVLEADRPGTYVFPPVLANFLRARLRAELGEPGVRALHARAAETLAARGDWAEAVHHYRAAGRAGEGERLLADAGRRLLATVPTVPAPVDGTAAGVAVASPDGRQASLRDWLAAAATYRSASMDVLALRLDALRRLDDAEGERRALEDAVASPRSQLSTSELAACYERLGELTAARGERAAAARYLDLALALEGSEPRASSAEPPPPSATARAAGGVAAGQLAIAADRAFRRAAADALAGVPRRVIGVALATVVGSAFLVLPVPADLAPAAWTTLALLAAFVPILVLDVVPDYVAALALVVVWAVLGLVPPRVALAGYASGTWVLVLAVLGLGAAVARSGLLYRAALLALTHLPATHVAQGAALALLGLVFTPGMPNATARTAMAAPLATEIADALGYPAGSRPRAGLALATLFGFGQLAGLFLTGSSTGLAIHGVLPPEVRAQFDFGTWALAALPLHAVILLVGLFAALRLYRPRTAQPPTRDRLALQWRLLGPPSRAERLTLGIFVLVLIGFVTQPLHHVDPAWVGLAGLCALLATGALDQTTFRTGVNWNFLLYLGVLVGLGEIFVYLKLDAWLAARLADLLGPLSGSPFLFLLALTLACFALSFVVRWQAAAVLLTLVLAPVAPTLGVNPWVIGLVALVATNAWFLPYQSTIYLALYYGMGESFTHQSVRPVAWAYAAAVLVGVVLSVPYWRALGLIS